MKIRCNEFVKRQTAESPFSYYDGSWAELEEIVEWKFTEARAGYKHGVLLVTVPARSAAGAPHATRTQQFYSGVVELTPDTKLTARFAARRGAEEPFVEVYAHGAKAPAEHVEIVLYSRALLVEEGENPAVDVDYEIVSINARATAEPEPMTPMAMTRNFLGLPGGTKAVYSAAQFAESIAYWSKRAMCGGPVCNCCFTEQDPTATKDCPVHKGEFI